MTNTGAPPSRQKVSTENSELPKYVMINESILGMEASDGRLDSGKPFFKSLDKVSKVHVDNLGQTSSKGNDYRKKSKDMQLNTHRPQVNELISNNSFQKRLARQTGSIEENQYDPV